MRIVNRKEFYTLPDNTLYSNYYSDGEFSGLMIKEDTCRTDSGDPIDYYLVDLIGNVEAGDSDEQMYITRESEEKGSSFGLDFQVIQRDGFYNSDQLYAVYEEEDINGMILALQKCLPNQQ